MNAPNIREAPWMIGGEQGAVIGVDSSGLGGFFSVFAVPWGGRSDEADIQRKRGGVVRLSPPR